MTPLIGLVPAKTFAGLLRPRMKAFKVLVAELPSEGPMAKS